MIDPATEVTDYTKPRDLQELQRALEPWLCERLGVEQASTTGFDHPVGAGVSNETIFFTVRYERDTGPTSRALVLRIHPTTHQLFPEPNFHGQFRLLNVLRHTTDVRVPAALWYESNPDLLGAPFFVMERVEGRVPVSHPIYNRGGWLVEAGMEDRRRLWLSAMEQLCNIHSLPTSDFAFLDAPHWGQSGDDQQIGYWTHVLKLTADDYPDASVDELHELNDWLRKTAPADGPPSLSWGDARIGNIIFDDSFHVAAVLDWEQASVASPMHDLGWWLFFDEFHSVGQGLPRLEGLGDRQETIAFWEDRVGRPVSDLAWHEVFAAFKVAVLAVRNSQLMRRRDGRPPYKDGSRFLQQVRHLIDRWDATS